MLSRCARQPGAPELLAGLGAFEKVLGCLPTYTKAAIAAEEKASGRTVHDGLAKDMEVVRMALALTGSVEGAKRQVHEYLGTFAKYNWLWKGNMAAEYAAFEASKAAYEATMSSFSGAIVTKLDSAKDAPYWKAEDYHQQYLQKDGQDATKGSLKPIQCYGRRGPIKKMDKAEIRRILRKEEL